MLSSKSRINEASVASSSDQLKLCHGFFEEKSDRDDA